jgi:hypothetical protein
VIVDDPEQPPPSRKGKEVQGRVAQITGKQVLERLKELGNVRYIFSEDQVSQDFQKRSLYKETVQNLYNSNQETHHQKTAKIKKQSMVTNIAATMMHQGKRLVQQQLMDSLEDDSYNPITGYCSRCNKQHIPFMGTIGIDFPLACTVCSKNCKIHGIYFYGANHTQTNNYNPTATRGYSQETSSKGQEEFSKFDNCLSCQTNEDMTSQKTCCCGTLNGKVKKSTLKIIKNQDGTESKTILQSASHGTFLCTNPACSSSTLSRDSSSSKLIANSAIGQGAVGVILPTFQRKVLSARSNHLDSFKQGLEHLHDLTDKKNKNLKSSLEKDDSFFPIHSENAIAKQIY